jgi:hypothetical protein
MIHIPKKNIYPTGKKEFNSNKTLKRKRNETHIGVDDTGTIHYPLTKMYEVEKLDKDLNKCSYFTPISDTEVQISMKRQRKAINLFRCCRQNLSYMSLWLRLQ